MGHVVLGFYFFRDCPPSAREWAKSDFQNGPRRLGLLFFRDCPPSAREWAMRTDRDPSSSFLFASRRRQVWHAAKRKVWPPGEDGKWKVRPGRGGNWKGQPWTGGV